MNFASGHREATKDVLTADATLCFPGGVGRTTSPEDFPSLINGVESRIFDMLPDDTWFYPGHQGDDSTLGAERPKLEEWRGWGW